MQIIVTTIIALSVLLLKPWQYFVIEGWKRLQEQKICDIIERKNYMRNSNLSLAFILEIRCLVCRILSIRNHIALREGLLWFFYFIAANTLWFYGIRL